MPGSSYSARDSLPDGTPVEVSALRPADRESFLQAVGHLSEESVMRRFFAPRAGFSEEEVARFVDIDFEGHVALVARVGGEIIGGARYIVIGPARAEMACAVVDAFQQRGVGKVLLRHLGIVGRSAGIREVVAEVLPENQPMLRLLRSTGLPIVVRHEEGAMQLTLSLAAGDGAGTVPSSARPAP